MALISEDRERFKAGEMAMKKVPFKNLELNLHPQHSCKHWGCSGVHL